MSEPPPVGFAGGPGYGSPQQGYPYPAPGQPPYPNPGGQGGYPPPGGQPVYPNPNQGYPPPAQGYPAPGQGYPPPGQGYPQPGQGGGDQWMPMVQTPANCPPGLEYLAMIDQLLIQQKVELLEAFTGFESSNKYVVKNSMGQKVYFAAEDTDCLTRNCCGANRPFDMKIMDNSKNEVIHLNRPLRCTSCWFPCCLQTLEVTAPPGTPIGYIHQQWSIFGPKFDIRNTSDQTVLKIEGPCCTWSLCGDVEFKILSADGSSEVGRISKQWAGIAKEAFTDTDNFGINFPMDLDVKMKATMLGAVFLIDFMFFEQTGDGPKDSPGML